MAWVSEIAPTTSSDVSFSPSAIASDTIELIPPRDGMNTRKKIERRALRMREKRWSMSGGGAAGVFADLEGGCSLPGMFGENHVSSDRPAAGDVRTGLRSAVLSASPWSAPVAGALKGFGDFCTSSWRRFQ